ENGDQIMRKSRSVWRSTRTYWMIWDIRGHITQQQQQRWQLEARGNLSLICRTIDLNGNSACCSGGFWQSVWCLSSWSRAAMHSFQSCQSPVQVMQNMDQWCSGGGSGGGGSGMETLCSHSGCPSF